METELEIPESHWTDAGWSGLFPYWERHLRSSIRREPDAAKRFAKFLEEKESGDYQMSPRLIFIEQPYLEWAEAIERVIEKTEKDTRGVVAYEITHPHADA